MASTLIMTPNVDDYNEIIKILRYSPWTVNGGWCNCSIPKWTGLPNWDFHCGRSDQGILFHYYYNALPGQYLRLSDAAMKDIARITHLNVGSFKPWRFTHKGSHKDYDIDMDVGMLSKGRNWIHLWKNFSKGNRDTDKENNLQYINRCVSLFANFIKNHSSFVQKTYSALIPRNKGRMRYKIAKRENKEA